MILRKSYTVLFLRLYDKICEFLINYLSTQEVFIRNQKELAKAKD